MKFSSKSYENSVQKYHILQPPLTQPTHHFHRLLFGWTPRVQASQLFKAGSTLQRYSSYSLVLAAGPEKDVSSRDGGFWEQLGVSCRQLHLARDEMVPNSISSTQHSFLKRNKSKTCPK
jgi:hypothetical protein